MPNSGWFKRKLSTDCEAAILVAYANGDNTTVIAERTGLNKQTVCNILERGGMPRKPVADALRRYPLNETAFDTITEESAYWIGFLMADGNVRFEGPCATTSLHLAMKDAKHVSKFAAFLGTTKPVRVSAGGTAGMACIEICSNRIAKSLMNYGVVPCKSHTAKVISLERNRHFWRGVVDGDGCVRWVSQRNYPMLFLCGSLPLMSQFRDFSRTVYPKGRSEVRHKIGCCVYSMETHPALAMIEHLYLDCTVGLDRKLVAAKECVGRYRAVTSERKGRHARV